MAKRGSDKTAGAAGPALGETITEEQLLDAMLISKTALKGLLDDSASYKEKIDGLTGELREEIKNAVEKKHLDKDAFADLKRLSRIKSNEKLALRWRNLIGYMIMTGVMTRINSVPLLPLDASKADAEETETEGDEKSGATPKFGGAQARTDR